MSTLPDLILSKKDFIKLTEIVETFQTNTIALLEEELARAKVVEVPARDVVELNSQVRFWDEQTQKEQWIQLVTPDQSLDAKGESPPVSVLAPVGAALIGLSVGQSIRWPMPNGQTKLLKVLDVQKAS